MYEKEELPYKKSNIQNSIKQVFSLSIPHCGISFPNEIQSHFKEQKMMYPDDTDWYLEKLYDFAASMGITVIEAVYSRWVIDLNRTPQNTSFTMMEESLLPYVQQRTFWEIPCINLGNLSQIEMKLIGDS